MGAPVPPPEKLPRLPIVTACCCVQRTRTKVAAGVAACRRSHGGAALFQDRTISGARGGPGRTPRRISPGQTSTCYARPPLPWASRSNSTSHSVARRQDDERPDREAVAAAFHRTTVGASRTRARGERSHPEKRESWAVSGARCYPVNPAPESMRGLRCLPHTREPARTKSTSGYSLRSRRRTH